MWKKFKTLHPNAHIYLIFFCCWAKLTVRLALWRSTAWDMSRSTVGYSCVHCPVGDSSIQMLNPPRKSKPWQIQCYFRKNDIDSCCTCMRSLKVNSCMSLFFTSVSHESACHLPKFWNINYRTAKEIHWLINYRNLDNTQGSYCADAEVFLPMKKKSYSEHHSPEFVGENDV